MSEAQIFNLLLFLFGIGIVGYIVTNKQGGGFSPWFAYYLWRKEKENEVPYDRGD